MLSIDDADSVSYGRVVPRGFVQDALANLNIPALLPAGPVKMLGRTNANGLIFSLAGWRVYLLCTLNNICP